MRPKPCECVTEQVRGGRSLRTSSTDREGGVPAADRVSSQTHSVVHVLTWKDVGEDKSKSAILTCFPARPTVTLELTRTSPQGGEGRPSSLAGSSDG